MMEYLVVSDCHTFSFGIKSYDNSFLFVVHIYDFCVCRYSEDILLKYYSCYFYTFKRFSKFKLPISKGHGSNSFFYGRKILDFIGAKFINTFCVVA